MPKSNLGWDNDKEHQWLCVQVSSWQYKILVESFMSYRTIFQFEGHRPLVEHGGHAAVHGPGVALLGGGVFEQIKDQYFALPDCFAFMSLMDCDSATEGRIAAVRYPDGRPKPRDR